MRDPLVRRIVAVRRGDRTDYEYTVHYPTLSGGPRIVVDVEHLKASRRRELL
jgi:hypothetical protein